jgi:hypothetical protein
VGLVIKFGGISLIKSSLPTLTIKRIYNNLGCTTTTRLASMPTLIHHETFTIVTMVKKKNISPLHFYYLPCKTSSVKINQRSIFKTTPGSIDNDKKKTDTTNAMVKFHMRGYVKSMTTKTG